MLYATSHLEGTFVNPNNAIGNTPETWAGVLNDNTSYTARWAMGDPAGSLSGTQTIRVRARKGTNSGHPTIQADLWEAGVHIQALFGTTDVTSTTGQFVTGTFEAGAISNPNNVEIEVDARHVGGNLSTRNSAQIAYIEWEVTLAEPSEIQSYIKVGGVFVPAPAYKKIDGNFVTTIMRAKIGGSFND